MAIKVIGFDADDTLWVNLPLFLEAREKRRKILGEDHPKTLIVSAYLAIIYHKQGKADQAEPLFKEALHGLRKVLEPQHNFVLFTMGHLARFYHDQGRDREALPLAQEAIARTDPDHHDYPSLKALLEAILETGKVEEQKGE